MKIFLKTDYPSKRFIILIVFLLIIFMMVSMTPAHGPKGHDDSKFTAFQAAKKGIALYDKLLASEKLSEPWETDLKNIEVFQRQTGKKREMVVKFSRSKGKPQSVYIFFTEKGEYSGSDFTGQ
jgi:hypothetical protein